MAIAIIAEHHALMSSAMWAAGDCVAQGVEIASGTFDEAKEADASPILRAPPPPRPPPCRPPPRRGCRRRLRRKGLPGGVSPETPSPPMFAAGTPALGAVGPGAGVGRQVYDPSRTMRRALVGIPAGMWMHAWFKCLDAWFPGKRTFGVLCAMAFVDWVGEIPYCCAYVGAQAGLVRGCSGAVEALRMDAAAVNMWNFVFWMPMDLLMFSMVPVNFQLLFVRLCDLVYLPVDSYLSNRSIPKPLVGELDVPDEEEEAEAEEQQREPRESLPPEAGPPTKGRRRAGKGDMFTRRAAWARECGGRCAPPPTESGESEDMWERRAAWGRQCTAAPAEGCTVM